MNALELDDVRAGFGPVDVLHGASWAVGHGEVCAVLGLNGAGKSASLAVAAGLLPVRHGAVRLHGRDVTPLPAHARVRLGLGVVTQTRHVLGELTVEDNLRLGGWTRRRDGGAAASLAQALELFPDLARARGRLAATLSGGERTQLALARALGSRPRVLLLDEPTAALDATARAALAQVIADVTSAGAAVLLVEQDVAFALDVADRVVVMQKGVVVDTCPAATVDPTLLAAQLGLGPLVAAAPGGHG